MRSLFARCGALAVFTVALDRLTKLWFMRLPNPEPFWFSNILTRTHHQNTGLIANFPIPFAAILILTASILVCVVFGLRHALRAQDHQRSFALSLVIAGAVGNIWDRLQWGFVFDWILLFGTSIINLADIAIALGILWYLFAPTKIKTTYPLDDSTETP